ncbi:MAG: lysoplasmalogenase [Gemmatimonadaceae bacterium]|nr:lysoplasmalogenase [Gemmatimonadaceae bacterium]
MRRTLILTAFALAVCNTAADALGMHAAVYLLKPLATLALVAIVLRTAAASRYRTWIAAGLAASLAGDILLMLPQGLFVPGLAAFLLAHLCYIRAFAVDGAGRRAPVLPAVPVFGIAAALLWYLWPSLGPMRVPVACYVAVISTMSWQAIARWRVLGTSHAMLAAAGSVFFLMSDSALAIRKFVAPFPGATLVILATYYVAQWGLTLSVSAADPSLAAGGQPLRVG